MGYLNNRFLSRSLQLIVMNFSEKKLWRRLMMTVGFTRGILFERMMRDSSPLWAGGHGGGGCGPDHGIVGSAGGSAGGGGK